MTERADMTEHELIMSLLDELIIVYQEKDRLLTALSVERHRAAHAERIYHEVLAEGSRPRDERMEAYSRYERERH
tara:strand:- start:889 stop:1113 length:225 start_codon:yes stop_codon:yes gene_type:complete